MTTEAAALAITVAGVTYLNLVLGELLPKRLAQLNPEATAAVLAPGMRVLEKVASPFVSGFVAPVDYLLRGLGLHPRQDTAVTHEEIKALVAQSQKRSAVYDIITNPTNVTVNVV